MFMVIVKAHVLTGDDDALSTIGSKHTLLSCELHKFLDTVAESAQLIEDSTKKAEEYLVHV
jgi:hypothetical protein